MTRERIACLGFWILATATAAAAQQSSNTTESGPASRVTERRYAAGNIESWRATHARDASPAGDVTVDAIDGPNVDGRMARRQEIVTATTRTAPNATETRRDVFGFGGDGRRTLLETTQSQQQTLANGDTGAVHDTVTPDLNGHTRLTSRQVDQARANGDGRESDTTFFSQNYNDRLRESARSQYTERRSGGSVRYESMQQIRDVNDRWQTSETRAGEVQDDGVSERLEEETIQRPDMDGNLALAEMNIIRSSRTKDQEQSVVETYAPITDVQGTDGRPPLSERIHRTTTTSADGTRFTVEELEARSPVSPNDPMRVIQRTETTVRPTGTEQWVTERRVFERDVNGRMQLVRIE